MWRGCHEEWLRYHERRCKLLECKEMGKVAGEWEVIAVATLQVKGIDEDLYRALGARAKRDNRSISQQVVKLIQDSLARSGNSAEEATRGFLTLCGSWEDPRSTRTIAAAIRKSRRSGRRFEGGRDVLA